MSDTATTSNRHRAMETNLAWGGGGWTGTRTQFTVAQRGRDGGETPQKVLHFDGNEMIHS